MSALSKDMLVDLYNEKLALPKCDYTIKRLLSPNSDLLVEFIQKHFSKGWASEVKAAIYQTNPTCFVAVDDHKIIGFACFDATAKAYFGPTGVDEAYRGKGIGKALLLKTLWQMKHEGYGYAIIGGVEPYNHEFYERACHAVVIDNSKKIYTRMI
jgi:GNAT superfamily N-acetyltransferase